MHLSFGQMNNVRKIESQLKTCFSFIRHHSNDSSFDHTFSVAPMMDVTDIHQRYLMRLMSKHAVLYTEMVTASGLVHCTPEARYRMLRANLALENPLVLQLGGDCSTIMTDAAKVAKSVNYKDININCGCPSPRVAGKGAFGAALMLKPDLVIEMSQGIGEIMGMAPSVKCRIGVDDKDSYPQLSQYIDVVSRKGGVRHFIVHARKAILNMNLTPKENRSIPPLNYDIVYQLVKDFPHLTFTINGGIKSYEEIDHHLTHGVCGAMVGRAVHSDPFYWSQVDTKLYASMGTRTNAPVAVPLAAEATDNNNANSTRTAISQLTRRTVLMQYCDYLDEIHINQRQNSAGRVIESPLANARNSAANSGAVSSYYDKGISPSILLKPVMFMIPNKFNGKVFRGMLSNLAQQKKHGKTHEERGMLWSDMLKQAMTCVPDALLDSPEVTFPSHQGGTTNCLRGEEDT